ncbi:MAG TPA: hypothetical protein VGJ09_15290, partial [Bryobacteraceae bacterium]
MQKKRLSLSNKIARFKTRLKDSEWRRYGKLLLVGKLTGVGLLLLAAILMHPDLMGLASHAQGAAPAPPV